MSALRLINETTATSVSSFQVNNVFTDDFNIYKIVISDIDSATTSNWSAMRFVNASGSIIATSDYDVAQYALYSNSAFTEYNSITATELEYMFYDNSTSSSAGVVIYVFNPTSTSHWTFMTAETSGFSTVNLNTKYAGVLHQTTSIKGFSIRRLSGSYNNIKARTYGLRVDNG